MEMITKYLWSWNKSNLDIQMFPKFIYHLLITLFSVFRLVVGQVQLQTPLKFGRVGTE